MGLAFWSIPPLHFLRLDFFDQSPKWDSETRLVFVLMLFGITSRLSKAGANFPVEAGAENVLLVVDATSSQRGSVF